MDVPADGQQIVAGGLRPGHHVEGFPGLHTGQGAGHHVAGVVTAAAAGDDVAAHGLFHQYGQQLGGQVVQLDGLAGGQLQGRNVVLVGNLCQELQPGQRQAAAGQAQAQHVLGAVPLGIAAKTAGRSLVILAGQFARRKGHGLFMELLDLGAVEIEPLFVHTDLLLYNRIRTHSSIYYTTPKEHKTTGEPLKFPRVAIAFWEK